MKKFAKLYETKEHGQILVQLVDNDNEFLITANIKKDRYYICLSSWACGQDVARKAFNSMTEDIAASFITDNSDYDIDAIGIFLNSMREAS